MALFFLLLLICTVAMGTAVAVLCFVYGRFGTSFGAKSPGAETIIVIVTAVIHTVLVFLAIQYGGLHVNRAIPVTFVPVYILYFFLHIPQMTKREVVAFVFSYAALFYLLSMFFGMAFLIDPNAGR